MRTDLGDSARAQTQAAGDTDSGRLAQRLSRARLSAAAQERARLARDLHDGVQNELVSLIVGLSLAKEDRETPPALAARLSGLSARAQSTLSGIRDLAQGRRPPVLAREGVVEAIRAQGALGSMTVSLVGTAPRSSADVEEAVYFACLEALQNVAKHTRPSARVTLGLRYRDGMLAVRIEDDGGGFIKVRGREGAGLTNIRDRVASVLGTARITSTPGQGTVVVLAVPWPAKPTAPTLGGPVSLLVASGTMSD